MNYIYLIKNNKGQYKVGFTCDLQRRMNEYKYKSKDLEVELLSFCRTQVNKKHKREVLAHKEIAKKGCIFAINENGNRLEWFYPTKTLQKALDRKGLKALATYKNNKVWFCL